MKKIITMEQYVIELYHSPIEDAMEVLNMLYRNAKLLQSKPTKEHFIGDNAIFDGWSVKFSSDISMALTDENYNIIEIKMGDNNHFFFNGISINTLSDLTKFKLKLK